MLKVLSLHFTSKCSRHCGNCYMKDKKGRQRSLDFFLKFPQVARKLGIKQIAIGGGEPSLFPDFVEQLGKECRKNKIILNMTTNGDGISEKTIGKFCYLTLISFSLDRFKVHSLKDIDVLFQKMEIARNSGLKVGVNLQLDPYIINSLYPMLSEIMKHADSVYLLQSKPSNIVCNKELKARLLAAKGVFGKLYVDDSLRMALGMINCCGRGREIVSIDFSGNAYKCSFDKPFAKLKKADDLIPLMKKTYPLEKTQNCPFI